MFIDRATINGTATGLRWGCGLKSASGSTSVQRTQVDEISAFRPASQEVWDSTDDNDTRFGSWEACPA